MRDWIQPYLNAFKGRITLSLLFGILGIGSGAMLLFISGYLISKSSLRPENIMIVYVPIVAVRAFSIGRAVFLYVEKLISHDLVLRMLEKMRTRLYHILEPQALFLRSKYQTGDLLGVLSDDIEHLQDLYLRTIFPGTLGVIIYGIIVFTFGWFDVIFALLMALMLGVLVFLTPIIFYYKMRRHHTTIKQQRSRLYQYLTDAIFGLTDWQASGRINEFFKKYDQQENDMLTTIRKKQKWHYVRDALIQLMIGMIIIATIIWTGTEANIEGTIAPTVIAAFTLMMFSVTEALMPVSESVELIPSYTESIERIRQVENNNLLKSTSQSRGNHTFETGDLTIHQMSYHYPNQTEDVLKNITLNIPTGRKIAILGRSGAGKSTLLKLISGALEPSEGTIAINGEKVQPSFLSKAVSVLNQKPHLFSTTIANNIRLGKLTASAEEVMQAANRAQLSPLIDSLPDGIHTPMLEMGQRFSGGERQRVAFARVLLQNTPIIVIDEATIGLDPKTEIDVIETMLEATKGKTVIWITHHLAGVEAMDEILFLEGGRISMQGSHEELMRTEKHYQKLYEMDQGR